jgi:hypothetical protein
MSLSKFLRSQSEGQGECLLLIKLDKLVQILLITLYVIKKKKKTASLICRYSGARLQVHPQQSFGNEPSVASADESSVAPPGGILARVGFFAAVHQHELLGEAFGAAAASVGLHPVMYPQFVLLSEPFAAQMFHR